MANSIGPYNASGTADIGAYDQASGAAPFNATVSGLLALRGVPVTELGPSFEASLRGRLGARATTDANTVRGGQGYGSIALSGLLDWAITPVVNAAAVGSLALNGPLVSAAQPDINASIQGSFGLRGVPTLALFQVSSGLVRTSMSLRYVGNYNTLPIAESSRVITLEAIYDVRIVYDGGVIQ